MRHRAPGTPTFAGMQEASLFRLAWLCFVLFTLTLNGKSVAPKAAEPPAGPKSASLDARRVTLRLQGLRSSVEIDFDRLGIPHIYAHSAPDAYFALGYVQARDRLFQMEIYRRRGSGSLAEVFGPPPRRICPCSLTVDQT